MELERQIIELIATDRMHKPISSMSGKLKRRQPTIAKSINFSGDSYEGDRVWARVDYEDQMKSRTLREGIDEYASRYPRQGAILNGIIEEKRLVKETYLVFGMNEGCRVTKNDYLGVMENLKFTEAESSRLYPVLMDLSHKMANKRNEYERSILIG